MQMQLLLGVPPHQRPTGQGPGAPHLCRCHWGVHLHSGAHTGCPTPVFAVGTQSPLEGAQPPNTPPAAARTSLRCTHSGPTHLHPVS